MRQTTTRSRRIRRVILAVVVIGAAAAGALSFLGADAGSAPEVTTVQIARGPVSDEVTATGTVQPVTTVEVGSQISGTIAWLGADYNSIVRKGQVVARLDAALLDSQVTQARASLTRVTAEVDNAGMQMKNAQQKEQRLRELWNRQLIARAELDAAELAVSMADAQVKSVTAQLAQARASLSQAEVNRTHTVIQSPIDGVVIMRSVDVGQTVSASTSSPTIFKIAADLKKMEVKAGVDESDIANIRPSQPVKFQVDAHPGEVFPGIVSQVRLEPTLVQNVITYSVVIAAANPDMKLMPGMTANVRIEIASRDDVLTVPNAALRFRPTPEMFAAFGQAPPASSKPAVRAVATSGREPVVAGLGEEDTESPRVQQAITPARSATTIDALFSPLGSMEGDGRLWIYSGGQLSQVPVRVGISDGQVTELIEGDLPPGARLVTGISTGEAVRATAAPAGGLFMPGGGMPGGGGRQGGGGNRRSAS